MLKNPINPNTNAVAHYCQEYQRVAKQLIGQHPAYFQPLRLKALEQFSTHGFPNKKQADWKYTSLTALLQTPYTLKVATPVNAATLASLDPLRSDYRLVFVNGYFAAHLSSPPPTRDHLLHLCLCSLWGNKFLFCPCPPPPSQTKVGPRVFCIIKVFRL